MSIQKSDSSFIERRKIDLPAGKKISQNIYGRVFACTRTTGPFRMNFNDGEFFDIKGSGIEWALVGEDRYARLQFIAAADTTVEFYGGNFFWHENVVTPVIKVAQSKVKPPATNPTVINAAATLTLPGGVAAPGSGYGYRKALIVTNIDPALDLDVLDSADNIVGTVFFRQANVFETSDTLKLKNNNGSAMTVRVMEIFYAEDP